MKVGGGGFPSVSRVFPGCYAPTRMVQSLLRGCVYMPHPAMSHPEAGESTRLVYFGDVDENKRASTSQAPGTGEEFGYRGKRLGLPESGPNSMASTGRRLVALLIDWLLCYVIALSFLGGGDINDPGTSWGTMALFAAENLLLVSTIGATVGKRIMRLRVVSVTQPALTPLAVLVRTFLLCLVVPAAIYDRDSRGFHDKAVGTAVVQV